MKQILKKGGAGVLTRGATTKNTTRLYSNRVLTQMKSGEKTSHSGFMNAFLRSSMMVGASVVTMMAYNQYSKINGTGGSFQHGLTAEAAPQQEIDMSQRIIRRIKKCCHFSVDEKTQQVFIFYDSKNALHKEFMSEVDAKQILQKNVMKYEDLDFVLIDLSNPEPENEQLIDDFLALVTYPKDKITKKKRPTLFIRADNRISKASPSYVNQKSQNFGRLLVKESGMIPVGSIKELAEKIRTQNKSLNDTTIVYCSGEGEERNETLKNAIRLMRQESKNPILVINDKALSEQVRMESGKFYVYYKPSFINGFEQYMEKDIDFNYLQAYEGVCRDEFTAKNAYIGSEEYKNILSATKGLQTEKFAAEIFDQCFTRSFNVEFGFNPNFKEFRRKMKHPAQNQKPLLFVYAPAMYMSRYVGEFKEVLKNYNEVFDIYYTPDESKAQQLFHTREFPEIFPYVVIIDPKKRKSLKSTAALAKLS